jgi:hypothetical protein
VVGEFDLQPYDMAALAPIVREAGGTFGSVDGDDTVWAGSALATNGLLRDEVLAIVGRAAGRRLTVRREPDARRASAPTLAPMTGPDDTSSSDYRDADAPDREAIGRPFDSTNGLAGDLDGESDGMAGSDATSAAEREDGDVADGTRTDDSAAGSAGV